MSQEYFRETQGSVISDNIPMESLRRQRTRSRLLDAAFDVFAQQGISAASVETICETAGFTRGAFYSNFSTKEELFFELMRREKNSRIAQVKNGLQQYLEPLLDHDKEHPFSEDEVLGIITRVQELQSSDRRWWLLQTEFLLLAMRDYDIATTFLRDRAEFVDELTDVVVSALASAGRRFTIADREAVNVMIQFCAADESDALLARDDRSFSERISQRLGALLLALTEHSAP